MPVTASGHATALWTGLHLLLLVVLSAQVVRLRQAHKVALGDGEVPALALAIRAFGNASEYVPAGLAALAVMAVLGVHPAVVHASGGVLFAGRVMHAVSLSRSGQASLFRAVGMTMTWLSYLFAGVALLVYAVF
jgi:uncharacterized membrane protein YecN with MAPEG domain